MVLSQEDKQKMVHLLKSMKIEDLPFKDVQYSLKEKNHIAKLISTQQEYQQITRQINQSS
jgi:hypothetical protein